MIGNGTRTRANKVFEAARKGAEDLAHEAQMASRRAFVVADAGIAEMPVLFRAARAEADELADQIPAVVNEARTRAGETNRAMQSLPDLTLKELAAGSIGLAAGLYVAGAPRAVVMTALAPGLLAAGAMATRPNSGRNVH